MKNKNISFLVSFLTPLSLDLEKSSARRRFLRHLSNFKEDYDLEGEYIRKEFGEKNPDGSVKVLNNTVEFTLENRKLADAKFEILNNLEIPIDWIGREADKEKMVVILNEKLDALKKATEFSDSVYSLIEILEEVISELK